MAAETTFGSDLLSDIPKRGVLRRPSPGHGGKRKGAGRPKGIVNRRSQYVTSKLHSKYGDALERAYAFCMRPVLHDKKALLELAAYLECSTLEAAEFYVKVCEKTFPYTYPRLAQIEVKPPGAPTPGLLLEIEGSATEVAITDIPDEAPVVDVAI